MDNRNSIELIAPAGSFEALAAAIQSGANAIYFGAEQLNMRSVSSINFSIDDLPKIVDKCKADNVKTYLTLNTIIYDHDLNLAANIIKAAKDAGVSAIIASDTAVIMQARSMDMPVHISTQANVTNIESVKFYANFAETIVLSRELGIKQIAEITQKIKQEQIKGPNNQLIDIEVFVHGALCMAVSGKCYLSLHSHNSSANRGACKQNCRKKYKVTDEDGIELLIDNEYIMSPKDLCTINFLDEILKSGVTKLKIEGRGRAADYVSVTTKCYKEAIESYQNNTFEHAKIDAWLNELKTVYNRDFWEGYYLGRHLGEWTKNGPGSQATHKKLYIGTGEHYFSKSQIAQFHIDAFDIKQGDQLIIIGNTTGVKHFSINELKVNDIYVQKAKKGDTFTTPLPFKIRNSDKLYKLVSN